MQGSIWKMHPKEAMVPVKCDCEYGFLINIEFLFSVSGNTIFHNKNSNFEYFRSNKIFKSNFSDSFRLISAIKPFSLEMFRIGDMRF